MGIVQRVHLLTLLCILTTVLFAGSDAFAKGGDTIWAIGDTQAHRQEPIASVLDTAGNLIVTGYRNLKADPDDSYWTVKYNSDGSIAWRVSYDYPNPSLKTSDQGTAIAVDSNNDVIVTGYVYNGLNTDIYTVKYNGGTGAVIWYDTYNGSAGGNDVGTAIAFDNINNVVYVGGYAQNASGNDDYIILKYNNSASGANPPAISPFIYNGSSNGSDRITSIAVGTDGVIATGKSWNGTRYQMLTVKYNFSGTKIWEQPYTSGGLLGDVGRIVKLDSNGNAVVTCSSSNALDYDIYTAKYSGVDGTKQWDVTFNGAFDDEPSGLAIDPAGNVYITGYTWTMSGSNDFYTARYNGTTGAVVWQQTFDSGKGSTDVAIPTGIVVEDAASGDLYVTGYTESAGTYDFQTVKYRKSSGHMLWSRSYNSPVNKSDRPIGIGIVPNGNVLVAGWSDRTAALDNGPTQATSGTQSTIQTTGKSWTTNQWQDYFVTVTSGANAGATRQILSNTADTLTVSINFGSAITAGTTYYIYDKDDYDIFVIKYDQGTLNPPTNLQAQTVSKDGNNKYTIRLTWEDNSDDETGFIIERKTGEFGTWSEVTRPVADTTSYDDGLLNENNYYYYRVKSYRLSEESYPSAEAHALTILMSFNGPIWQYIYNSSYLADDFATGIAVGPDNNPVVTGRSDSGLVGMFDYYTVKLNSASGADIWSDRYDSMQNEMDMAACIAVDNSNNVIVSGLSSQYFAPASMNINSIYTIKYPSTGPPLTWEKQYNGPGGIDDRAVAVASANDGSSTIVVGYGKNSSNNDDIYIVKYLADGTQSWAATPYNGGRNDYPSAVALDSSGNIFITGYRQNGSGQPSDTNNYDFFTAKYNGTSGVLIWSNIYNVTGTGDNKAKGIVIDSAGDAYITGYATNAGGNADYYTIKYNGSNGTRIWERAYDGPTNGNDRAAAIKIDPISGYNLLDGNIIVIGTRESAINDQDIHIIRYSTAGVVRWERTLQRVGINDAAVEAALDGSGYIYIAGDTGADLDKDILGAIYDYEGTFLGGITYSGGSGHDQASAITANRLGEAFIAGYRTNSSGNSDYAVLKMKNNYILAPTPFTVAPQSDFSKINLGWQNNTAGTTQHIERTPGPVTADSVWTEIAIVNPGGTTYQDTGLTAGTNYCYRIEAVIGSLMSRKPSGCATTTLAPPSNVTLTGITTAAITISWQNVTGNTGYKIERMPQGGQWADLPLIAANITTYTNTGLTAGTTYSYRVSTNSAPGYSSPSSVQTAPTLTSTPTLNAPTVASSSQINLTWPDVTGETGYRLERKTGSGGTYAQIGGDLPANTVSYNDTGLNSGTLYYYRLKAFNTSGESGYSTERQATTLLQTPALSTASATSETYIALTWTDPNTNPPNGNETGVTIEYSACTNTDPTLCSDVNAAYWGTWFSTTSAANVTSRSLGPLVSGRTYRFRVTATLSGANSTASNMLAATTWLTGPTNLTATALTDTSVKLDWSDILGETNYDVQKNGVDMGLTLAKDTITYTATGLTPNTTYNFKVKPFNGTSSAYSNQATATTPVLPPTLNSVTAVSSSQIDIGWTDVTGETGYEIWRSGLTDQNNAAGGWAAYALLTTKAADVVSHSDTGITAGYTYKYKVRYVLSGPVYSAYSGEMQATTIPATPTLAVTGISKTQVNLSWNNVYGETGYNIQYKPRAGADCTTEDWTGVTPITKAAETLTHSLTPLTAGIVYCYRMNSYNAVGSSPWSTAITKNYPPTLNTLSGVTQTAITLTWNNVPNNTGYRVERSTDNVTFTQVGTDLPADTVTLTNTSLTSGQIYYYRVRTITAGDLSAPSDVQSATTIPPTPTTFTLTPNSTTQITATWNNVAGETGYKLQQKLRAGADCTTEDYSGVTPVTKGVNVTTHAFTGLTAGTVYCFRINAYNAAGDSPYGTAVTKAALLAAPTLAPLSGFTASNINLSWNNVTGNTGYKVERSPDNTTWTQVATPAQDVITYSDSTGLSPGTLYYYRVSTKNILNDYSVVSNVQNGKTTPSSPTSFNITVVSASEIGLKWQLVSGATNYSVYRRLSSGSYGTALTSMLASYATDYCGYPYPTVACPTATPQYKSYQDTGLPENTAYCYQVTAWNTAGYESVPSTEQCKTTAVMPSAALTTAAQNPFTIKLDWTPGSCSGGSCEAAGGYDVERKQGGAGFGKIAEVPASSGNTYTQRTGINPNTSYTYRVRPFKLITDDFNSGINTGLWTQSGSLYDSVGNQINVNTTPPINFSSANGSYLVSPENGALVLQTTSPGGGTGGSNSSRIYLTTPGLLRDDFEVTADFTLPNGHITSAQTNHYLRLRVNFGSDNVMVDRAVNSTGNNYAASGLIEGVSKSTSIPTGDLSGKLRITRSNGSISMWAWTGGGWNMLLQFNNTTQPDATYLTLAHNASRIEAVNLKTIIDNVVITTDKAAYSNESTAKTPVYVQGTNTCP